MEKENKNIHRGKILHESLKNHLSKIKEIVEAAGYKYGTFYKHKNDPNLSYEIIAKYGNAMGKDFSVEFPEMANLPSLILVDKGNNRKSYEQLQNEVQELREKYSHFLDKHNTLLEANIALREENIRLKEEISELRQQTN
ncbi:hypothetical protein JHJ32_07510 [Parapedobacter sp. ISTM3]|uniref:hypothetical protein n=1 Tax=Parapedobacter sp. ISTM3 TaxID=2800130 RepID=UPI001903E4CE|nr:hypothetical protein [Parapedobacter sp. ISTM3]MBK1439825.1 hypothetical protein [Parapedobacter sp. ISTM3]